MIRAFYTGQTGATEHQKLMAVAANNIANVNTDGYKTSNLSFQELLYQRVRMPDDYEARSGHYDNNVRVNRDGLAAVSRRRGADDDDFDDFGDFGDFGGGRPGDVNYFSENKLRVGVGARSTESALVMTQGAYRHTDNPFDVMINGNAFFAVLNRLTGEISYTRHGAFGISNEGGEEFLVTAGGEYVLDENYNYVLIPENRDGLRIVSHFEPLDEEVENFIRIGLFTCDNIYGLLRIGENRYMPTPNSGEMGLEARRGVGIIQHALEMSNVQIAEEMVKVIQAQRAFQSNLTVIRTADEIAGYTNQLRQ
jgi:flagellar basal-body rod protein FlgG